MAHIDHIADKPRFLSSFFCGATFEAGIVSLGCLAIALGVILAHAYVPLAMEFATP